MLRTTVNDNWPNENSEYGVISKNHESPTRQTVDCLLFKSIEICHMEIIMNDLHADEA